jgi:thiamine-monophosphate kinase
MVRRNSARCKSAGLPGEDELVGILTRGLPQTARTLHGPGDDCAVIAGADRNRLTLFKTDCVVQDVHFRMEVDAARVGWKAMCRVISDIAASGGEPGEALVTVAMPRTTPLEWVQRLYAGIKKAARRYQCGIAGGETSSVPDGAPVFISVAMLGSVERRRLVLRSGGRAGDIIYVTGRLGGASGGKHLDFKPRLAEARWLVENAHPTAMMDLSDGLGKDLPRLAKASGCGSRVERSAVPCSPGCGVENALSDGEDYELLFTWRGGNPGQMEREWRAAFPRTRLTAIGVLTESAEDTACGGWDHFAEEPMRAKF